ncbi:MAG: fumarate hydratase [Candidatus Methanomethyliaceae archaeon]|nr:fumarate hydratase [Candidatus Methanomethyliaceae archaeon]
MRIEDLVEAIRVLETDLPADVEGRLKGIRDRESGICKTVMEAILENVRYARERGVPMCQDTGILEFFVRCAHGHEEIRDKIAEAVRRATHEVPLRTNTVNPFTRENEGANLGRFQPIVHFEGRAKDENSIEMSIIAKGAGSENVSASFMLDPMQGVEGVKRAVVQAVQRAGAKPCPPVVVGVGVGGNLERSAHFAKKALLRPLDEENPNRDLAELEEELVERVNALGIGPMGLGGDNTTIGVLVEWGHCHTASLPVSVNIQCWALRRISLEWRCGEFRILR